jgi:hypothetical protein
MMLTIFDAATGKLINRELTLEEITEYEKMQLDAKLLQEQIQAEQDAKASARASALAKLVALGLTEEEIGAL